LRNIFASDYFFYIFLYILSHLKLEFELAYKKLKNTVLFNFFTNLISTVNANAGEYSDKIYHVDGVDVRVVADMRRLLSRQLTSLLQTY